MQRRGRIGWTCGLFCDFVVMISAGVVVFHAYDVSIDNARMQRLHERELDGPLVDWSNAYEGWRANTGEPIFDLPLPWLDPPLGLPPQPIIKPIKRLPPVKTRPLVPVRPARPPRKASRPTGPVMWA